MTMFLAPYTAIADIDGSPLDAGFLFFGEYNKDPESFPVPVYWDADFTVPAAQPIRTRNGYPVRNGSPTKVYLKTAQHSIVIKNRNSAFILVDFKNKGWDASFVVDASGNTQQQINDRTVHVERFRYNNGVSKTDQQAIQDAVNYCLTNNRILNWDGANLSSTANIDNFWSISHCGQGSITRNDSVFYINPKDRSSTNTVFVSPAGSASNDGLSKTEPKTLLSVVALLGNLGDFSLNAQWKVKLLKGTYTDEGLRISKFPKTTLPVVFEGDDLVAGRTVSNWSGVSSVNAFAFRLDSCDSMKNMSFLKIGFSDWSAEAGNAGALVGNNFESLNFDQCEFLRMPIGVWATRSKGTITRSLFEDCDTWGICAQHNSRFNVGNTNNGMGNTFRRCASAISAGRLSIIYIENNDFYEIVRACEANKLSRIRVGVNRYHSWNVAPAAIMGLYYLVEGALFNKTGTETYNLAFTNAKPCYYNQQGSTNTEIQFLSDVKRTASVALSGSYSDTARISVDNAAALRIPYTLLYTTNFTLEIELTVSMTVGKTAVIDIAGAGSAEAAVLARATLPAPSVTRSFKVRFKIYRGSTGLAYYDVECPVLNYYAYYVASSALNNSNTQVVSNLDSTLVLRTYVQPGSEGGSINFYHLESSISI